MSDDQLDRDMVAAVRAGDKARIVRLYAQAAEASEATGDVDRACFFYTHAWVFAMEAGDPLAEDLRAKLVAHGRETDA
ncbi:MAG: hypothetical protein AAGA06_06405 [Pseudomonadota bacterium]